MDNKNIDRLFEDKFKAFEKQPRPDVWFKIEDKLRQKRQKKTFFYLSVAASFLIMCSLGFFLYMNDAFQEPIITENTINDRHKSETKQNLTLPKENPIASKPVENESTIAPTQEILKKQIVKKQKTVSLEVAQTNTTIENPETTDRSTEEEIKIAPIEIENNYVAQSTITITILKHVKVENEPVDEETLKKEGKKSIGQIFENVLEFKNGERDLGFSFDKSKILAIGKKKLTQNNNND